MSDPNPNKSNPIPMLLWCPECGERHIDMGEFAHKKHHTHACQFCGMVWRPAINFTYGVQFLPGFRDGGIEPNGTIVMTKKEYRELIGE